MGDEVVPTAVAPYCIDDAPLLCGRAPMWQAPASHR